MHSAKSISYDKFIKKNRLKNSVKVWFHFINNIIIQKKNNNEKSCSHIFQYDTSTCKNFIHVSHLH